MTQSRFKEFLFLLRREFLFQLDGRTTYGRGVYPGVNWFALLCIGALLLEFNASRLAPESSSTVIDHFTFLTLAQTLLIALRSTVYCALSLSRDLQNHTATVVRVSPVSKTLSLLAKLCACLAPLWIELVLFLPVSLLFFSVYLWLPPILVASAVPFLFAVSLMCGCLGLAVGSTTSLPVHAARNARLFIFFLLFFIPVLRGMSESWIVPLSGLALMLSVTTRRAPHRVALLGVFSVLVAGMGLLDTWGAGGFQVSHLHPLSLSLQFYANNLRNPSPGLLTPENFFHHPLVISGLYFVIALIFFALARIRYRHAR